VSTEAERQVFCRGKSGGAGEGGGNCVVPPRDTSVNTLSLREGETGAIELTRRRQGWATEVLRCD